MDAAGARVREASSRKRRRGRAWWRCLACAGIAVAFCSTAAAQIYKCIDASGRVLYGDAPCPGGSRGEVLETHDAPPPAPGSPLPERAPVPRTLPVVRSQAEPNPSTQGGAVGSAAQAQRYQLSVNERQRVANLEQTQRTADNGEKREAARMEIAEIQRGTLAKMSHDDLRRKEALWVDIGNLDAGKRQTAVQQLSALFATYR